jgi:hypothetical protein
MINMYQLYELKLHLFWWYSKVIKGNNSLISFIEEDNFQYLINADIKLLLQFSKPYLKCIAVSCEPYAFFPSILLLTSECRLLSEIFQTKTFQLKWIENSFFVGPVLIIQFMTLSSFKSAAQKKHKTWSTSQQKYFHKKCSHWLTDWMG